LCGLIGRPQLAVEILLVDLANAAYVPSVRKATRLPASCLLYVCSPEAGALCETIADPVTLLYLDISIAQRREGRTFDTVIGHHSIAIRGVQAPTGA
jgi:hypothetical protein